MSWIIFRLNIYDSLRAWKAPETAEEKEKKAKERAEKLKAKKEKKTKRDHDDVKSEDGSEDDEKAKFLDIYICFVHVLGFVMQNFMVEIYKFEIPCMQSKEEGEKGKEVKCLQNMWHSWRTHGMHIASWMSFMYVWPACIYA